MGTWYWVQSYPVKAVKIGNLGKIKILIVKKRCVKDFKCGKNELN